MSIRPKVISRIISDLSNRFRVVDNTGEDKKVIGNHFPDIIIYKKEPASSDDILFVLKVENGGELIDSVSQWKDLSSSPYTFYIITPKAKLDEAKKLAGLTGISAQFGWYGSKDGEVTQVHYE